MHLKVTQEIINEPQPVQPIRAKIQAQLLLIERPSAQVHNGHKVQQSLHNFLGVQKQVRKQVRISLSIHESLPIKPEHHPQLKSH